MRAHKVRDRDNCGIYRPVSLTSTVLKTAQGVLCSRKLNHLEAKKLVMVEQYGFRQNISRLLNLTDVLDEVMDWIDRGERVEA